MSPPKKWDISPFEPKFEGTSIFTDDVKWRQKDPENDAKNIKGITFWARDVFSKIEWPILVYIVQKYSPATFESFLNAKIFNLASKIWSSDG